MTTRISLVLAVSALIFFIASGAAPSGDTVTQRSVLLEDPSPEHAGFAEADSLTLATHSRLMQIAREQNFAERPAGEVVQLFAEQLLGAPYVAHMLDQQDRESLVLSLTAFDCVLFNEAVLSLAKAVIVGRYDFAAFAENIESFRYRDGRIADYCSRLHYYTDWLRDNARRGNVRIITNELRGAQQFRKRIDFMTANRQAYRSLENRETLACVAQAQADLNTETFMYVPQSRIREVYQQLQPGDILAMTTSVGGLDIAHTGLVYRHRDGRVGIIHASTTGEVRIDPDLATYVQGVRNQNGIMVARLPGRSTETP
jgi:hypothetical protein